MMKKFLLFILLWISVVQVSAISDSDIIASSSPCKGFGSAALPNGSIIISVGFSIQRTDDCGKTFVNVTTVPFADARLASSENGTLFAWYRMDKLYRSIDYGKSWSVVHQRPDPGEWYWNVCFNTSNNDIMWASGYGGGCTGGHAQLYKSPDHGASWSLVHDFGRDYRHIHEVAYNPANGWLYAVLGDAGVVRGGYAGVFRSKDGGISWVRILGWRSFEYVYTSIVFNDTWIYLGSDQSSSGGTMHIICANDTGGDNIEFSKIWDRGMRGDIYWMRVTPNGYLVIACWDGIQRGMTAPLYVSKSNVTWTEFLEVESLKKESYYIHSLHDYTSFPTGYLWATDKFGGLNGNILLIGKIVDGDIRDMTVLEFALIKKENPILNSSYPDPTPAALKKYRKFKSDQPAVIVYKGNGQWISIKRKEADL